MSGKLDVTAAREAGGCVLQVWVRDPDLHGKPARVVVKQRAHVKRGSPVHHEITLADRSLLLAPGQNRVALGIDLDDEFVYVGDKLDLQLTATLTVDDGVLFDTKVDIDLSTLCRLPPRTARNEAAKSVHSPPDRFNFIANLRAIPAGARAKVLWLLIVGVPIVVGNLLLGTRDQFVPESRTWFYDHSDSDGGSESPLMKALVGSGALGAGLWALILAQLRRYMTFDARCPPGPVRRDTRWQAAGMIGGSARVPLQQATLRVVAYNREHGQYTKREKRGKSSRTVTKSFVNNACGVVLYERLLPFVPAQVDLAGYLDGEVELQRVFDALYPPRMLGANHGLSLQFEVQLLHPEYVDQEVILAAVEVDAEEFYRR
ncbi:hypothetical protein [Chiayiivirga flava]|uniref:Uncharacterized protein n=1 Tax=Chiayiivirga flava TaxID=659595 RepID=A0A7W8D9R8_9GAMM|nr:hypothetical protein [Chiayiivirga flava]MBB5209385.1 hypothetical protein [Chiayiivirga flava]